MNVLQLADTLLQELGEDERKQVRAGELMVYVGGSRNAYYTVLRLLSDFDILRRQGRSVYTIDWRRAARFAKLHLSRETAAIAEKMAGLVDSEDSAKYRAEAAEVLAKLKDAKPVEASA